jgi:hypothetical protein
MSSGRLAACRWALKVRGVLTSHWIYDYQIRPEMQLVNRHQLVSTRLLVWFVRDQQQQKLRKWKNITISRDVIW